MPQSIQRYLHIYVLALFACATFGSLNGLAGPFSLFVNPPVSTDSEEEKDENEREGVEQAEALYPPGSSQRRNFSRYVVSPSGCLPASLPRRQAPRQSRFSADPARDLIASGSGLFQRC
ncbi:hypothetical protein [Zavarzinella formosa]|uniref:hypothetical protein n=1 Tax=Zavarzinella formosa TaxID=360055 RepID=UPI0012FC4ECB|nr:hypothetical protein [Zavarzinella formosa]